MASGQKTAVGYTDDDGADYITVMKSAAYTANGAALGAVIPEGNVQVESVPNGLRTRKVRVVSADKDVRWVTVYTLAADAWTQVGTAVTLLFNGVDKVFYTDGTKRDERKERKPIRPGAVHA